MKDIIGSEIIDKMCWDESKVIRLYNRFIVYNTLQDLWLKYLKDLSEQEANENISY